MADHCAHCGINLAKINPADIVGELKPKAERDETTLETALKTSIAHLWCSQQCRVWWTQRQGVVN